MVRSVAGGAFDIDIFHVINRRDDQLVADEILHGAGSSTFVYDFTINGQQVAGVSVVGARHLAAHYKGLKHRLVASMQKTGELFVAQSFPGEGGQMAISAQVVPELAAEDDFYAAVIEIQDVKTGNAIQVERREARYEKRRDGSRYERPNYQTIAQSKAYRNAVLALIPQDVLIRWKQEMLKLRKSDTITSSVLDEKRSGVLRFATQHGLAFDRRAIEHLTLEQIGGLGDAARQGQVPAFVNAAHALGLDVAVGEEAAQETGRAAPDATQPPAAAGSAGPSQAARRGRPPGPRRQQEEPPPVEDEREFGEPEQQQQEQPPTQRRQVDFDV
jgi:hypothetical protein